MNQGRRRRRTLRSSCRSTTKARPSSRSSAPCPPRSRRVTSWWSSTTSMATRRFRSSNGCSDEIAGLRALRNDLGRGVLNAMKAGIAGTTAPYVLISMADGSDEPQIVDPMVALPGTGRISSPHRATCAAADRLGVRSLKRLLSRVAGLTLHWFAGVPTHDPTNNFKLYSRSLPRCHADREHAPASSLPLNSPSRRRWPGDALPKCQPRGEIGPPVRATSSCANGFRTTCTGTAWRSSLDGSVGGRPSEMSRRRRTG